MQKLNHVCSHYWKIPSTLTNSVNFQENLHPLQDYSENYSIFQQNRNKQQTPYYTNYLSSDDDDYHQPDIFAPYTKTATISTISKNLKIYPQNPADMQNQQPMHIQNAIKHILLNLYNNKTQ